MKKGTISLTWQSVFNQPRVSVVVGVLMVVTTLAFPSFADYETGQRAWEESRYRDAISQWLSAADAGDGHAMLALGRAYLQGLGGLQDFVESHKWFNLASSHGVRHALTERDILEARMTPEERATAHKLAREWRPVRSSARPPQPDPYPTTPNIEFSGPPPEAIREAQMLLAELGYQPGLADGVWGSNTRSALQAFLRDSALPSADSLTPLALLALRDTAEQYPTEAQALETGGTVKVTPIDNFSKQLTSADLFQITKVADIAGLDRAIAAGADVNQLDAQGWSLLMQAVNMANLQIAELLIEAGADVNVRAPDGATALFMATVLEQPPMIEALMKAGADVLVSGPGGQTAVTMARQMFGDAKAAQAKGMSAAVVGLIEGKNWNAILAWQNAGREFSTKMGRQPTVDTVDESGLTDLHRAAEFNLPRLIELMLAEGMNVNTKNRVNERTALHHAVSSYASDAIIVLLAYGANVNSKDRFQYTPLHFAAQNNAVDIAKILIDHGADLEAQDRTKKTPLHDAARRNSAEIVEFLISRGAKINARDQLNYTPLHYAYPGSASAKLLVASGAILN